MIKHLFLLLLPIAVSSQELTVPWSIEMNNCVVQITVHRSNSSNKATGFLAKYKERGYLITAKHVVSGHEFGGLVDMEVNNGDFIVRDNFPVYFDTGLNSSDVAVFPLPIGVSTNSFFELQDSVEANISDPIIFIGYPSTLVLENAFGINTVTETGQISPLVKRGYIAGFDASSPVNITAIFDAQSVSGFSGSPVFVRDRGRQSVQILGVMAGGYKANVHAVRGDEEIVYPDHFYLTSLSYGNGIGYAIAIIDNYILKGIKPAN